MVKVVGRYRLCIFDLDGTLVDSLRDIAESINDSLEILGLPPRPVADYRYLVGEGVPKLCERVIGGTHPHLVARLAELGRAAYRVRPLRHTRAYAGIDELIGRLRSGGVRLAVLSNKPHELTAIVVAALWPEDVFDCVVGYTSESQRKPSPEAVNRIRAELGFAAEDTCLVGDTPTDVETGRRAGTDVIAVTWGFRTRDDLLAAGATCLVDRPDQIV